MAAPNRYDSLIQCHINRGPASESHTSEGSLQPTNNKRQHRLPDRLLLARIYQTLLSVPSRCTPLFYHLQAPFHQVILFELSDLHYFWFLIHYAIIQHPSLSIGSGQTKLSDRFFMRKALPCFWYFRISQPLSLSLDQRLSRYFYQALYNISYRPRMPWTLLSRSWCLCL